MNGRAPAYRKCNEVTLVKEIDGKVKFYTFWKNVHQQFLVSSGYIYGCTYEVVGKSVVTKEEGNELFLECRKAGWVPMKEYFQDCPLIIQEQGTVLF